MRTNWFMLAAMAAGGTIGLLRLNGVWMAVAFLILALVNMLTEKEE